LIRRIFCAVRHSSDPSFYYGGLWSGNFYPALRRLGSEIIESKVDLAPLSRFMHVSERFTPEEMQARARITEQILEEVREAHRSEPVDLFLSYFYNAHFDPAGFDELRRLGIPSVNFYCNSIYQFELVADIARGVDFAWHAERDAGRLYMEGGARPVWVQMGADPEVYRPIACADRQKKACFIGQRYADRDRWVAALIRAEIPIDVYGPGWSTERDQHSKSNGITEEFYLGRKQRRPGSLMSYWDSSRDLVKRLGLARGLARIADQWRYRQTTKRLSAVCAPAARGRVSFDRQASVFGSYEVFLNFSNVWLDARPGSRLIPHVRLRDFEAPMSRACYLTGHTDEIGEFYDIGSEIDTYRDLEELTDKTRYYLRNRGHAERLRAAGYRRALRDHTWQQRFSLLFRKIGMHAGS